MNNTKKTENPEFVKCVARIENIFTSNKNKNPLVLPWTKTDKVLHRSIYLNKSVIPMAFATFFVGEDFPNSEKLIFELKPLYTKLASLISEESGQKYKLNFKKIKSHYVIGIMHG